MPRRISRVGGFRRTEKRRTRWGATDVLETNVPAGTTIIAARFTAVQLDVIGPPLTVIRERGVALTASDQTAATELWEGAIGFAVVTEAAAAAGVASMPAPITDADWDGWYAWYGIQGVIKVGSNIGFDANGGYRTEIDSKAMRKVNDEESLVILVENASATTGFNFSMQGRTLFKLH